MKKVIQVLTIGAALLAATGCSADASSFLFDQGAAAMLLEINGKKVNSQQGIPYLAEGKTVMIPLRSVLKELGAKIEYSDQTADAIITKGNMTVLLFVGAEGQQGSSNAIVNGKIVDLKAPVCVIQKTTYVPVSFVSAIGGSIDWIGDNQAVTISLNDLVQPNAKQDIQIFERYQGKVEGNTNLSLNAGFKYVGEINSAGKPDGHGLLLSERLQPLYQGGWNDGLPEGQGVMQSLDKKLVITAAFRQGMMQKAKIWDRSQSSLLFFEGKVKSPGVWLSGDLRLPDGRHFIGTFNETMSEGKGVIRAPGEKGGVLQVVKFEGNIAENQFTYFLAT